MLRQEQALIRRRQKLRPSITIRRLLLQQARFLPQKRIQRAAFARLQPLNGQHRPFPHTPNEARRAVFPPHQSIPEFHPAPPFDPAYDVFAARMLAPGRVFRYNRIDPCWMFPRLGGVHPGSGKEPFMHILITNDDGIHSDGLRALVDAALRRGHRVTVSAPSTQCSANSQHITLTHPLLVHEVPWPGAKMYAVDGTPTDCVRVCPYLLDEPIDFCLSGINNGENAGSAVYYSGTVAAAREAVMCYMPAMAVSIMPKASDAMRKHLADLAVRLAEYFHGTQLPRFTIININAPALPPEELKPLVVCPLSRAYYLDGYEKRISPLGQQYLWLAANDTSGVPMEPCEPGSDYDFLRKGHITCTFLGGYQDYNGEFAGKMQDFPG